jgi:hypothetical protein
MNPLALSRALLRTPSPQHAFALCPDLLIAARRSRRRDRLESVQKSALAPGWYQLGPVGVLQVDRQPLADAVAAVALRLGGPPARAGLVVPDSWVRSLVLDFESVPRRREEAEEVVRWRLKRVLPCRPEEVRLDFVPAGTEGRLLVTLALDKPLAVVEDVFLQAGTQIGVIEPVMQALTPLLPADGSPVLLAVAGGQDLDLLLAGDGRVRLVRHKTLPDSDTRGVGFLLNELSRTVAHARDQEDLPRLEVWLAASDPAFLDAAAEWSVGQQGIAVRRLTVGPESVPPGLQAAEMIPAWALFASGWQGQA